MPTTSTGGLLPEGIIHNEDGAPLLLDDLNEGADPPPYLVGGVNPFSPRCRRKGGEDDKLCAGLPDGPDQPPIGKGEIGKAGRLYRPAFIWLLTF